MHFFLSDLSCLASRPLPYTSPRLRLFCAPSSSQSKGFCLSIFTFPLKIYLLSPRSSMADKTQFDSRPNLITEDVQGADNSIPLSPQWLLPKPGENKTGVVAGENPNHSPEIEEPSPKIQKTHENGVSENKAYETSPFLRVKRLSEKALLPSRASPLSAGYDLSSAVETKVPARGKALVPTDLSIAVPEGTYARIAPRSGLAWKHSIDVGAGVVDADYRGPVGVILFNYSDVDFEVKPGDRIAQLIIEKIVTPEVTEVDDLDSTARGSGGFGSTGV